MSSHRPAQPSCADAAAALCRVREKFHDIDLSLHAIARGKSRNFDLLDIEEVLDNGQVSSTSWHAKSARWVYVIEGRDRDGDELTLVVDVDEDPSVPTITIVTGR